MGNVNMEASQINYRNNSKPSLRNVSAALTNLFNSNTSIIGDINELTETVNLKADKLDIAPFFDEESHYYIGDLVFESGRLWKFTANHEPGEWNQEEVTASNIDMAIKEAGGGGAELKVLKYTGTGTASYTLDFGEDTPATILQIVPEPGESVITNNYEYLSGFAWGVPFAYGVWANKSNNLPTNHGGFNISTITFSNNTCTITGPSASAAANYEGQKYAVYYLA